MESAFVQEPKVDSSLAELMCNELTCPICYGFMTEPHTLLCGHTFCGGCLQKSSLVDAKPRCAICRTHFTHSGVNIALRSVLKLLQQKLDLSETVNESDLSRICNDYNNEDDDDSFGEEKNDMPTQLCDSYTFGLASWYSEGQRIPSVEPMIENSPSEKFLSCKRVASPSETNYDIRRKHVWQNVIDQVSVETRNSYTCGLANELESQTERNDAKSIPTVEKKKTSEKNLRKVTQILLRLLEAHKYKNSSYKSRIGFNRFYSEEKEAELEEEEEEEKEYSRNFYSEEKTDCSSASSTSNYQYMYDEQVCNSYTFGLADTWE